MTRLEQYLTKMATKIHDSNTTFSRYYTIGNVKVRVSDHYSPESVDDFQIITSYNGSKQYTIFFKNSTKVVLWTAKQFKEYLPAIVLWKEMTSPSMKPIKAINANYIIESKLEYEKLNAKQREIFSRGQDFWAQDELGYLSTMLMMEFTKNAGFNGSFQNFLKMHKLNYCEAISMYKYIVIDRNIIPNTDILVEAYKTIFGNEDV